MQELHASQTYTYLVEYQSMQIIIVLLSSVLYTGQLYMGILQYTLQKLTVILSVCCVEPKINCHI